MSAPQGENQQVTSSSTQATTAAGDGTPAAGSGSSPGFPPDTALEQMTVDQREAYWKHQARKHEDRVKAFGKLTPEELADLRAKAERVDKMEYDLSSATDKAVADAKKQAEQELAGKYLPKLARAHIEGAANGRLSAEALAQALEFTDLSKFINNGDVDTGKVRAFVDSIAPVTGNQQQQRPGPSSSGQGNRAPVVVKPGDAGRLAAIKRGFITADK